MAKKRDPLQPDRCAEVLAALAVPERLRIIRLLADGERNVTVVIDGTNIPPLNVSRHLTVLNTPARSVAKSGADSESTPSPLKC